MTAKSQTRLKRDWLEAAFEKADLATRKFAADRERYREALERIVENAGTLSALGMETIAREALRQSVFK